jgi:proteasome lid subunit RPN8/RPN11
MIVLRQEHATAIMRHGEVDYPYECCGLIFGGITPEKQKIAQEIFPISNAREETAKRNRFLITAEEMMRGELYARKKKLEIIGVYHSHPDHPARPSPYDLDHAWPFYSFVIVSVLNGKTEDLQSWELENDRSKFNSEHILQGDQICHRRY